MRGNQSKNLSLRLPEKLYALLEQESERNGLSHTNLVKNILERHIQWNRYQDQMKMIPVPKSALLTIGKNFDGNDIEKIVNQLQILTKDMILFLKSTYTIESFFEFMDYYLSSTNIPYRHTIKNGNHEMIIKHNLGFNWSLLLERFFLRIFNIFNISKLPVIATTDSSVSILFSLDLNLSLE